jgi:negative regulator of replication initiation
MQDGDTRIDLEADCMKLAKAFFNDMVSSLDSQSKKEEV